ncbi:MAG: PEP-CTERM sorting domain-containing protein [Candidatus Acidiferrales bacterium]
MKLSSLFVAGTLVAALTFAVPLAKADGLPPGDPQIKAAGDDVIGAPSTIITASFQIVSPTGTSPVSNGSEGNPGSDCFLVEYGISFDTPTCQFRNELSSDGVGFDINALFFSLPTIAPSSVNCFTSIEGDTSDFGNCVVTSDGGGGSNVLFDDGMIPYNTVFTLAFAGFPAGFTSGVYANVPEPTTLPLLLVGFVALLGIGLKRRAFQS